MKKFLVLVLSVALLGLFSMPEEAGAKRFGGGKSFGKKYNYSRQAKPPQRPAQQQDASRTGNSKQAVGGNAPRRGGLLGPIAGLAAGGLLAAMFFGGAFEGFQMFDFLMIGLLAFAGIMLFRRFAGGGSAEPAYSGAGGATPPMDDQPQQRQSAPQSTRTTTFDVPEIGSGLNLEPLSVKPDWFSEPSFMAEAESHFRQLQAAWDRADMDAIKEYVTPEMYKHVSAQQQDSAGSSKTEVVELSSQLLDLLEDGEDIIAAILFSGTTIEDGAQATEFSEVWHVRHPLASEEGDWLIDGIHQYPA